MKNFGYVIAALSAIAVAAPSIASAETVMARDGDHHRGARAEFRDHARHEGMHRHHGDRMVVIKHRHHEG